MSVEPLATEEAQTRTAPDRYADLATALAEREDVEDVEVRAERLPPRVRVVLGTANVTGAVSDLLVAFGAQVVPDSVEVTAEGTLAFDVVTPERFKAAGTRDAREYGSSTAWTFTREALELSGFDADTTLDARAREGAVLLTRREE